VDSVIETENIAKDMDSYSHGKEQLYHNSETGRLQKLMLTPAYQGKNTVFF